MTTCGISYKLQHTESNGLETHENFSITFTYVASRNDQRGHVRLPRTWHFPFRSVDGFMIERLGASETRGLFGGVENQRQKMYSEVCERAIGEVLTATFCEIMDNMDAADGSVNVIIFGQAFPKVVGRFASLRPPSNVNVMWVCPRLFPEWIAKRVNAVPVVPAHQFQSPIKAGESWEDESLVVNYEYTPESSNIPCTVQHFQIGEKKVPPPIELPNYFWVDTKFAKAFLPREIPLAAGYVQNHMDRPYLGSPEEELRSVTEEFKPGPYKIVVERMIRSEPLRWPIQWVSE